LSARVSCSAGAVDALGALGAQKQIHTSFPLPAERIDQILRGLGDQLTGIYQAEMDAVAATARAIR
jgi:hypothetical protein